MSVQTLNRFRLSLIYLSPKDVSEIRRVFGMVNQLGKFIPDLAPVTDPLRALLKDKAALLKGTSARRYVLQTQNIAHE